MSMEIVLGVNGSPASAEAVRWTARFGPRLEARVHSVMAVHRYELWELAALQVDYDPMLDEWRSHLEGEWTEPLRRAGLQTSWSLLRGDPAEVLCDSAARRCADFLVIGSANHSALHDLLGCTAHRVVKTSSVPVIAIPLDVDGRRRMSLAS